MCRCARCFGELHELAVFCPNCAQLHEPEFNQLINRTVGGRFQIYRRLGQGGLSTIFAATDLESNQAVVVKVSDPSQLVRRDMSYSMEAQEARRYWTEMIERMRREAEALVTIEHPNIVRFYGSGTINNDLRYVVMEYVRGRTLRQELDIKRRLELDEAIQIALEVCSALTEVHSRGIIHRDINPRNIMIADCGLRIADCSNDESSQSAIRNPQSAIKLIDFGIAKFPQPPGTPPFTQYSTMSGTVAYASPEQCRNRLVDHRTDIYSLGIVLYEMLTGSRPFEGRTPTEIALKQIQAEPIPLRTLNPDLPAGMEKTILRALAKNPDQRQQTVEGLAIEMRAGSGRIIVSLNPPDDTLADNNINDEDERLRLVRRSRRRTAVAAAAIMAVVITAGVLFGKYLITRAPGSSPENTIASASPSPTTSAQPTELNPSAPGSDADAMELASRLSQDGSGTTPVTKPIVEIKPIVPQTSNNQAHVPITRHKTLPAPPNAKPKLPPAPAPDIAARRVTQPTSLPDITQAPHKEDNEQSIRPESDNGANNNQSNTDPAESARTNGSGRDGERPNISNRDSEMSDSRRSPSRNNDNINGNNRNDDQQNIGPKIIQWSGRVDRERVVRIEMPGVPGIIDIPRIYRDRVGVVEPPGSTNDWRCAVLRVFGRGSVSILVRWWPLARGTVKFTARR